MLSGRWPKEIVASVLLIKSSIILLIEMIFTSYRSNIFFEMPVLIFNNPISKCSDPT